MTKKNILTVAALLLAGTAFQGFAQNDVVVSGTVKDVYGNPLPGVVISSNRQDVYITDRNGEYSVTVDKSKDITFSLLGFKQETLAPASGLEVVLKDDAHSLAEKINFGTASQYREVATEAVSSVYGDKLEKSLMSRLQGTLSGQLSGLTTIETGFEPTYEDVEMYIRGIHTIHGGTAGVVIDGIFYDTYVHDILYRISPEEVESVSVLKDGASQAIYGIKGANGLIVITTKRGTPGKLKVGVNISETVEQPSQKISSYDSFTHGTMRNQAAFNDGRGKNFYFSDEVLENMRIGVDPLYPDTDWYGMLVRDFSNQQRVALNATGGSDKVTFYSNLNLLRQGSFWNTDQKDYKADNEKYRVNFRTNIDIKVNSWIGLYMNLAGSIVKSHAPGGSVATNGSLYDIITYMPSTVYGPVSPAVTDDEGNVIDGGGKVITSENMQVSPYGNLNRSGYANQTNTNIYGQGGITFDLSFLTPGLSAQASVGYLSYITASMATTQNYARYIRQDDYTDLVLKQLGTTIDTDLAYSKGTSVYGYLSAKAQADYVRDFGRHHVSANAYLTYQRFNDDTGNIAATYDFRRIFSGVQVAYDFDRRYAVRLSTGYSASDYFPRATRFLWTPGVSAGWIASNENFIKDNAPWLSLLKVRGSYAITGNDATGYDRYAYTDQVKSAPGGSIQHLAYNTNESVYGNAALKPEQIKKTDFGVDLGFLNQFSVSFDVFKEKQDNGVYKSTALVPSYQGIALGAYPITNFAKFENKGWELNLGYSKRFNKDWGLFLNGHLDYNENKVIFIGETDLGDDYAFSRRSEGYPYGQAFGYKVDWSNGNGLYNFQSEIDEGPEYSFGTPRLGDIKFQDLNKDGVIDEKDEAPIGNGALPRYNFAFNAGFTFRNFEVNLLFQGVGKYQRNYQSLINDQSVGDGVYTESHLGAWTPERWLNDETITMPALSTTTSTSYKTSDFLMRDASFLRLKNAEIAYRMPKKVCDFLNAGSFRVYVSGQNLLTFDRMETSDMFVEGGAHKFPIFRMYRVGIDLTF